MTKNKISTTNTVNFTSIAIDLLDQIVGGQAPLPQPFPQVPGSEWVSKGDGTGMVVIHHPNGMISAGPTQLGK